MEFNLLKPSVKTIKKLFALSGNICAFPECKIPIVEAVGTITGEICHIHAQNKGGPRYNANQSEEERHEFGNLILLCKRHHKIIDDDPNIFSVDLLQEIKAEHENKCGQIEKENDHFFAKMLLNGITNIEVVNNHGNIIIDSPGTIVSKTVNIKTQRKKIAIQAPSGTIGADQNASRYISYLIERYNSFASKDLTRPTKFHHGAISKNIRDRFHAEWRLLSIENFTELCIYLITRISKTRLAKSNVSKGIKFVSSYEEFLRK